MIKIQASVTGYTGRPSTIFAAHDKNSGILAVVSQTDFKAERVEGCVLLTNDSKINRDCCYGDKDIDSAIRSFFAIKSRRVHKAESCLIFDESVSALDPSFAIERDGIDTYGTRYRVSEAISCAQIAVLFICLYVDRSNGVTNALSMANSINSLMYGKIITI